MKKDNLSPENLTKRLKAPTPLFWKKIRRIMLGVGSAGAVLASGVVAIPAIITIGGYMVAAGTLGSVLSSLTTTDQAEALKENETKQSQKNQLN